MDCFAKGLCGEAGRDYHLVLSLLLFPIRGPKRRIFLLLFIMTLCSGHLNTATCGEMQKQRHWTRSQDGRLLGFIVSISWHPTSPHGVPSLPPFYAFISQTGQNSAAQNHPRTIITSPSPSQPVFTINFSRKMKNIEKLPIGYLFEVKDTGGGKCYFLSWIKSAHLTLPNACDVLSPNNVSHSSAFLVLQFVNILWLSLPSKDIVSHL